MTSIFLNPILNESILVLKNILNMITPEFLNTEENIDSINNLYNVLIEKKKEINSLRDINPTPSDITYIEMYSDAVGDKIILLENRIQELQNVDAAVEIGGRRTRNKSSRRRRNKNSKGSKRRRR